MYTEEEEDENQDPNVQYEGSAFNNKFWRKGVKAIKSGTHYSCFDTPHELLDAAVEYFDWADERELQEQDFVGKDGKQVIKYKPRVFTYTGLATFLGLSEHYFQTFRVEREKELLLKTENKEKCLAFLEVLDFISDVIRTNKYTGAASGFFNANLVIRDFAMSDSLTIKGDKNNPLEHNHTGDFKLDVSNMSDEELQGMISKVSKE